MSTVSRTIVVFLGAFLAQPGWRQTNIDTYIRQGWDTLSRSMSECQSLVDEKYNVETESSNVQLIAGYQNVIGFGWTNAVYLEMEQLLHDH